jgi:hypothetical protein
MYLLSLKGDTMKKTAAAMAVLAAAGFTGLSMAPASAAQMFQNCSEAQAAGYYNIPIGSPAYSPDLDGNSDGVACEGNAPDVVVNVPTTPEVVTPTDTAGFDNCTEARAAGRVNIPIGDPAYAAHLDRDSDGIACEQAGDDEGETGTDVIVDYVPESWGNGGYNQVGQVPAGGADTGVTVETGNTVPGLAVAGGLTLAAAAGATVIARRRAVQS